jgi:ribonuclease VapC
MGVQLDITLPKIMRLLNLSLVPVSEVQAQIGHWAYQKFGKGRHTARLNFGDCVAYACRGTRAFHCSSRAMISPGPTC